MLVTTLTSALVAGVLWRLAYGLKLPLAERLEVTEKHLRGLAATATLMLIPMLLVGGLLIDSWGISGVLMAGSLFAALGLTCLIVSQSVLHAFGSVLLIAMGGAWVATASVVLMPAAFFAGSPTASTNLGFVVLGLGMLLAPALAEALPRKLGFRRSFALLALACLLAGFLGTFTPRSEMALPSAGGDLHQVLEHPFLWLAALSLFLARPLEEALSARIGPYLTELGYPERAARTWWGGYCVAFLSMRLVTAYLIVIGALLWPEAEPWWIWMLVLIVAITLGNLVGSYSPAPAGLGVLLTGACLGPLTPELAGLMLQRFPEHPGAALGALLAVGTAGELLLGLPLHAYAQSRSARQSLRVLTGLALLLTASLLVLGLVR
jgi:hypothetical protein